MRAPELMGLVRIQRRVYAAVHHARAALLHTLANLVTAKGVAGVNADPDDVTGLNAVEFQLFQRLVDDLRRAIGGWRRPRQHEEPTRRDDADAERQVARVDEMHSHRFCRRSAAIGMDIVTLLRGSTQLPETRRLKRRHTGRGTSLFGRM
jgi:hypothetical protein